MKPLILFIQIFQILGGIVALYVSLIAAAMATEGPDASWVTMALSGITTFIVVGAVLVGLPELLMIRLEGPEADDDETDDT